jgi:peroxiredoxin
MMKTLNTSIGISPDSPQTQKKFDDKHNLGFPLLSDPEHDVAEAYGVCGEKKMYGKTLRELFVHLFSLTRKVRSKKPGTKSALKILSPS